MRILWPWTWVIDFDYYSLKTWHVLNEKYSHLDELQQYYQAFCVIPQLTTYVASIVVSTSKDSFYIIKLKAFTTLVAIAESVTCSDSVLGCTVRTYFQWNIKNFLTLAMFRIVHSMTYLERGMVDKQWVNMLYTGCEEAYGLRLPGLDFRDSLALFG